MDKKKKVIIWSAVIGGCVLLALILVGSVIYRVSRKTSAAQAAAEEFAGRLAAGELTVVRMKYYPADESGRTTISDEDGNATVRMITDQDLISLYGEELVTAGHEEEMEEQDRLFAMVMRYSQLAPKVSTVFGTRTLLSLTFTGPDFRQWLEELSDEEVAALLCETDDLFAEVESRLAAGAIPTRTTRLSVPMIQQSGVWKFDVSEEMEKELFGGLAGESREE